MVLAVPWGIILALFFLVGIGPDAGPVAVWFFALYFPIFLSLLLTLLGVVRGSHEIRIALAVSWGILLTLLFEYRIGREWAEIAATAGITFAALSAFYLRIWVIAAVCTLVCAAILAKSLISITNLVALVPELYQFLRSISQLTTALIVLVLPCAAILLGAAVANARSKLIPG
jgi:hypothetical protein